MRGGFETGHLSVFERVFCIAWGTNEPGLISQEHTTQLEIRMQPFSLQVKKKTPQNLFLACFMVSVLDTGAINRGRANCPSAAVWQAATIPEQYF